MFKNKSTNRMMALAVVAMFMLSAFGVLAVSTDAATVNPASENSETNYYIAAIEGTSFTYTPQANMSGVTFSASGVSGLSMDPSTNTISGTLTASNSPQTLTVTATWTGGTSTSGGVISQTIHQYIHFMVYNHMEIDALAASPYTAPTPISESVSLLTTNKTWTESILASGMNTAATFAYSNESVKIVGANNEESASDMFTITNGVISVKNGATALTAGHYKVYSTVTGTVARSAESAAAGTTNATEAYNTVTESVDYVLNIFVADTVTITTTEVNTYIGKSTDQTKEIEYSYGETSTIAGVVFTFTDTNSVLQSYTTSGQYVIKTRPVENTDIVSGDYIDKIFTVQMTGTVTPDGGSAVGFDTGAQNVTMHIYKELKFTTAPTFEGDTAAYAASANKMSVLVSSTISAANHLVYDWGDGTKTEKDVTKAIGAYHTMSHTYSKAGAYLITVTASNEFGSKTSMTLYNAYNGIYFDADRVLDLTGIKTTELDGGILKLEGNVVATAGVPITYTWTYSTDGAEPQPISAGEPEWVDSVSGKTLTLVKDQIPDNTKFTLKAEVTFGDDEEPTSKVASYTYNDTSFFGVHGWLWIVFVVLAALLVVAIIMYVGFNPYVIAITAVVVVFAVLLFVYKDFGGIWNALTGLFSS